MHNYYGGSYRGGAVGAPRSAWGMSVGDAFSTEIRNEEYYEERSGEAVIKAWRRPPGFHRGVPVKHTKALAWSFLREYSRARRLPKMVVEDTELCLNRMLDGNETIRDLGLNSWGPEGLVRALVYIAAKRRGLLCHDNLPMKLLARTKELMRMRGVEPEARTMGREDYAMRIARRMGLPGEAEEKAMAELLCIDGGCSPITAAALAISRALGPGSMRRTAKAAGLSPSTLVKAAKRLHLPGKQLNNMWGSGCAQIPPASAMTAKGRIVSGP